MKKPTTLAKAIIDRYYSNGCDKVKAYCEVKKIKEPAFGDTKRVQYNNIVSQILNRYPDYKTKLQKDNKKIMKNVKDKLIDSLEKVNGAYEQLLALALKETLTDEEQERFKRLRSILSTSDLNKVIDTYAKLTGSYEAEKHEVTTKFNVNFGGRSAILKENNKDIIENKDNV